LRPSWTGAILGYVSSLIIIFFLSFMVPSTGDGVCYVIFIVIIIMPTVGCLYGLDMEKKKKLDMEKKKKKEKSITLKEQHLFEIKQLLKEYKTITQIEEKIKNWKDEGYNVAQLEKMIDDVKQPMVKKQKKAKDDLIDKEKNKYCHNCGSNIEGNPKFCKDCGTEL